MRRQMMGVGKRSGVLWTRGDNVRWVECEEAQRIAAPSGKGTEEHMKSKQPKENNLFKSSALSPHTLQTLRNLIIAFVGRTWKVKIPGPALTDSSSYERD